LEQIDGLWDKDWEQTIRVLDAFRRDYPNYSPAKNKLYAALVSYGQQLGTQGQCEAALRQLSRAEELNRIENLQRTEAVNALRHAC
jgi:hypothetical protein